MSEISTVTVDLGERAYDIIIGQNVLSRLNHWLAPKVGDGRVHIVTDATVDGLHGHRLDGLLSETTKTVWFVCHGMGYLSKYFLKYFKELDPEFNYILLCNKICGAAHYIMQMDVIVESQTEYDQWLGEQKAFIAETIEQIEKEEKQLAEL